MLAAEIPRVRRHRVFGRREYLVYVPLTLLNLAGIGWFLWSWIVVGTQANDTLSFWVVSFIFLYALAVGQFRWALLPWMSRPEPMPITRSLRVGVATTFVPGIEPLEMLEVTVRAMLAMRTPHDNWVLDEGDDPAVRAMCERLGAHYFTRKNQPRYQTASGPFASRTKHGNYNAWFDATAYDRYDVIVGFDPDHIPDPDFLEASLGYLDDPSVGYVQLPQAYYNQRASFIARGAAEETYAYYSTTQMFAYTAGFPIVTGCHHTHRVSALRDIGGFAVHDADDLLITLHYRAAGWQGVYVPEIRARGLTPTDWTGYLRQQLRWARSVIDVKLRSFPGLAGKVPVRTRLMGLLHGFYYVQEGLLGLLVLGMLVYMLASGHTPAFMSFRLLGEYLLLSLLLMTTDFYRQRFFLDRAHEWGLHLRASVLRLVKWPYILFGMIDAVTGRSHPYATTPKVAQGRGGTLMTWPHLVVAGVVGLSWAAGTLAGHPTPLTLHLAAGFTVGSSLLGVWTETWRFAQPFDLRLVPPVRTCPVLAPREPHIPHVA